MEDKSGWNDAERAYQVRQETVEAEKGWLLRPPGTSRLRNPKCAWYRFPFANARHFCRNQLSPTMIAPRHHVVPDPSIMPPPIRAVVVL